MNAPSITVMRNAPSVPGVDAVESCPPLAMHIPTRRRTRIKNILHKLPWGMGRRGLVPILRWILSIVVYHRPLVKWKRKRVAHVEAARLEAQIQRGALRAAVVYDLCCSPPTFGDYLVVILLARYLQARGLQLEFYLITSELRPDWDTLSREEAATRMREEQQLAVNLLRNSEIPSVQVVSWTELQQRLSQWNEEYVVPFFENIKRRIPLYNHCFNLLNVVLRDASDAERAQTLFDGQQLMHVPVRRPPSPYIAWHARYSKKWGPERNIDAAQFFAMYRTLTQQFPQHAVVLVSDAAGCDYFRALSNKLECTVRFSKDFSDSFLGDAALVLQSDHYFQLHGGGIGIFPMFSRLPYTIVGNLANEERWSSAQVTSWQTPFQEFIEYQDNFSETLIPNRLLRVARSAS